MRYPRELIEEIRMQNDIVDVISQYVPLKQKGVLTSDFALFITKRPRLFPSTVKNSFITVSAVERPGMYMAFSWKWKTVIFPKR